MDSYAGYHQERASRSGSSERAIPVTLNGTMISSYETRNRMGSTGTNRGANGHTTARPYHKTLEEILAESDGGGGSSPEFSPAESDAASFRTAFSKSYSRSRSPVPAAAVATAGEGGATRRYATSAVTDVTLSPPSASSSPESASHQQQLRQRPQSAHKDTGASGRSSRSQSAETNQLLARLRSSADRIEQHQHQCQQQLHHSSGSGGGARRSPIDYKYQEQLIDEQLRLRESQKQRHQRQRELAMEGSKRATAAAAPTTVTDLVEQTADLIAAYQETVGRQEDRSLRRLTHHLGLVEEEWARRAELFQRTKDELEEELVEQFMSLRRQEQERAISRGPRHDDDDGTNGSGGGGQSDSHSSSSSRSGDTTTAGVVGEQAWQSFLRQHFGAAHSALLSKEAEFQSRLEARVVQQVAVFVDEYKRALDADYEERCGAMDARVVERDRRWVAILAEERKLLALQQQDDDEEGEVDDSGGVALDDNADTTQKPRRRRKTTAKGGAVIAAVTEAMAEVAALRDQLARDSAAQQGQLMRTFLEKRRELSARHAEALERQTAAVAAAQRQCAAAVLASQAEVDALQSQLAARDVEVVRLSAKLRQAQQQQQGQDEWEEGNSCTNTNNGGVFSARCAAIRTEVGRHWQSLLDDQAVGHAAMLEVLTGEYAARVDSLRAEQQRRLAEMAEGYRSQAAEAARAAAERWRERSEEVAADGADRSRKAAECEAANRDLKATSLALVAELARLKEAQEGAVAKAAAAAEAAGQRQLSECRARYEQTLAAAAQRHEGSVPAEQHERTLLELQSARLRLVELTATAAVAEKAARDTAEGEWACRMQEQTERHRGAEAALVADLEGQRGAWRQSLRQAEDEWHRNSQACIDRLRAQLASQLEQERASCQAIVAAAHASTEARVSAFLAETERGWAAKYSAFEAHVCGRQEELGRREDALTNAEAELKTAAMATVQAELQQQRAELFASLDRDQAALVAAREGLAEQQRQDRFRLQRDYEERFFAAKQKLRGQQAALCAQVFQLAEEREAVLLAARDAEMVLVRRHHDDSLRRLASHHAASAEAMAAALTDGLAAGEGHRAEAEAALLWRLSELHAEARAATAAACRALTEAHAAQLAAEHATRTESTNGDWRELQRSLLEQTARAESERRAFESSLRRHCEEVVAGERERSAAALEEQQAQHTEQRSQWEAAADRRHANAAGQREADAAKWAARVEDLTSRYEGKLDSLRSRLEATAAQAAISLAEQHIALTAACDARLAELSAAHATESAALRTACEARVGEAADREGQLRGQLARDLVAVEKRHLAKTAAAQRDLQASFGAELAALRAELHCREERLASVEAAAEERVGAAVTAAVREMEQRYEAFTEAQEERLSALAVERQAEGRRACEERAAAGEERLQALMLSLEARAAEEREREEGEVAVGGGVLNQLLEAERAERWVLQQEVEHLRRAVQSAPPPAAHHQQQQQQQQRPSIAVSAASASSSSAPATPALGSTAARTHYVTASPTAPRIDLGLHSSSIAVSARPPAPVTFSRPFVPALTPRSMSSSNATATGVSHPKGSYPAGARATTGSSSSSSSPTLTTFLSNHCPSWTRLLELWGLMETTAEERAEFRQRLSLAWTSSTSDQHNSNGNSHSSNGSSTAAVQGDGGPPLVETTVAAEVGRLEAQLPLLEAFARRQYLLEQQQQRRPNGIADATDTENANDDNSSAGSAADEVEALTRRLRREIPQHERYFGQTFVFRGDRLMEQLC